MNAGDLRPPPDMVLRIWPDEALCVAFVPSANSTHLLTREAGELLLAAGSDGTAALRARPELVSGLRGVGLLRSPATA